MQNCEDIVCPFSPPPPSPPLPSSPASYSWSCYYPFKQEADGKTLLGVCNLFKAESLLTPPRPPPPPPAAGGSGISQAAHKHYQQIIRTQICLLVFTQLRLQLPLGGNTNGCCRPLCLLTSWKRPAARGEELASPVTAARDGRWWF